MPDPLKQTWQLQEILRGIGENDLITENLWLSARFNKTNLVSWSEDMVYQGPDGAFAPMPPWEASKMAGSVSYSRIMGDDVIELSSTDYSPESSTEQWVIINQNDSSWSQDIEVSPGQSYIFSFYAQPIDDYQDASFAVINLNNGEYIVEPKVYGGNLTPGDFTRIESGFTTPSNCTRVRLYLVYGASAYLKGLSDEQWVEYTAVAPNSVEHSTAYLNFAGESYPVDIATLNP